MTTHDTATESPYQQTHWTLAELLREPSEDALAERVQEIDGLATELEASRSELTEALAADRFLEIFDGGYTDLPGAAR